ncbi:MAG: ferredoxin--NADP reductase, partial [Thermoplasmatota archaeon]
MQPEEGNAGPTLTTRLADALAQLCRPAVEQAVRAALHPAAAPRTDLAQAPRRVARVVEIHRPTASLVLFRLELAAPLPYAFKAGQFCMVHGDPGPPKRPYSIASAPSDPFHLDFAVKDVNDVGDSGWLYGRKPGDVVELGAPKGTFTFTTPPGRTAVFLATGTGVAPFRSMLLDAWGRGLDPDVWLYVGAKVPEELPYHDEFTQWVRDHPRFHYVPVVSRADVGTWTGEEGHVQAPFLRAFAGRTDFDAYLCGVPAMVA